MNKGQIFKNNKGEAFEFVAMVGSSVVGKKQNGKCAYLFTPSKNGLSKGIRVPLSLVAL